MKLGRFPIPVGSWRKLLAPDALAFQRQVGPRAGSNKYTGPVVTSHGFSDSRLTETWIPYDEYEIQVVEQRVEQHDDFQPSRW